MVKDINMSNSKVSVLVTGANGFIGKNLILRLSELSHFIPYKFIRGDTFDKIESLIKRVDVVVHLAGENRPRDACEFERVNSVLTKNLCNAIKEEFNCSGRQIPIIFASSIQAILDNPYGKSKLDAEQQIEALFADTGNPAVIYRLPGVFGKWCKPNYNSVVATFCYNISRGMPIKVNDPNAPLELVYIDDLVASIITVINSNPKGMVIGECSPVYKTSVGELVEYINSFEKYWQELVTQRVGGGLLRALYATYLSYFPPKRFVYELPSYVDSRGMFVEILKTYDSGQFSFFTAQPGITRGGHYHHTKSEKFLVIKGQANFRFRHVLTDEIHEILVSGDRPQLVDSIPGWTHSITNVGSDEIFVLLWANEVFDRQEPDTVMSKV